MLKINRGIKAGNVLEAHTDSVVGLYGLVPYKITQGRYKDTCQLISASIDNTIRVWDPKDM